MENFTKIIRPFTTPTHEGRAVPVYCSIKFTDGKLSITGVEGPRSNGDCYGWRGQIDMHEWEVHRYAPGWTRAMVKRFREIWGEYHLNDMRAYNAAMKAAGWDKLALEHIYGHEFTLTTESINASDDAKKAALAALKNGETFTPSAEQVAAAARPYSVKIWTRDENTPDIPDGYQCAMHTYGHGKGNMKRPEKKTLGWVRPSEHPDGLLGRKLNPDDEHGYGQKWSREDVPADVLEWLRALPDADTTPAWV